MLDQFHIDAKDFEGPVLITGAGGCIGSWALSLLSDAGVKIVAFDLTEDKRRPRLLMAESDLAKVQWLTGDISDTKSVAKTIAMVKPCAIIHLAALQVPFCKADPVAGANVNVVGTVNVFEAARRSDVRRVAYASSIAAHGAMEESQWAATLYGAYKLCNEHTARVYFEDFGLATVGLRPGVVYGVGRDQGMTSKTTVAILAAAAGKPYSVPFTGPVSWLHAGEVASAFIKAISIEREEAAVFDINGSASTVEQSLQMIRNIAPSCQLQASGDWLPFPMELSDLPVRHFLGDYGKVALEDGIRFTYDQFKTLLAKGLLSADNLN
jgi:nucleoside-diphosphate-sugar epimerase